jgi:hypothetical protein
MWECGARAWEDSRRAEDTVVVFVAWYWFLLKVIAAYHKQKLSRP